MGTEYNCTSNNSSFNHGIPGTVLNLNNLKIHMKNFTWNLDYRTPNNQLKDTLNLLLENKLAVVKSYITRTRIVTKEHDLSTTSRLDNNIFNRSIPYKIFVSALRQNRYNGSAATNSLRIQWENITDFRLSMEPPSDHTSRIPNILVGI